MLSVGPSIRSYLCWSSQYSKEAHRAIWMVTQSESFVLSAAVVSPAVVAIIYIRTRTVLWKIKQTSCLWHLP